MVNCDDWHQLFSVAYTPTITAYRIKNNLIYRSRSPIPHFIDADTENCRMLAMKIIGVSLSVT